MKNELTNPIVDEVSQERFVSSSNKKIIYRMFSLFRDLHDNLKMSISFTDLAVNVSANQTAFSIISHLSSASFDIEF